MSSAPLKALTHERLLDWKAKLRQQNVVELCAAWISLREGDKPEPYWDDALTYMYD